MSDDDNATPEDLMEMFMRLVEALGEADSTKDSTTEEYKPATLQDRLAIEGNFDLIAKLRHVEAGTPGYGTIIVHKEGFSEDDETHNLVLDWLHEHQINVLNPSLEITRLERALHSRGYHEENVS